MQFEKIRHAVHIKSFIKLISETEQSIAISVNYSLLIVFKEIEYTYYYTLLYSDKI